MYVVSNVILVCYVIAKGRNMKLIIHLSMLSVSYCFAYFIISKVFSLCMRVLKGIT
jgi:hypothetical protein